MSAAAVLGVAWLGGLVGLVVPPLARRFTDPPARPQPRRGEGGRVWLPVSAAVFGGLAVTRGDDPALPVFLLVAAVGLVLARVDLACLRLPDPLVRTAGLVALTGLTGAALLADESARLVGALAGATVAGVAHVLLALLPGSRLGFGDVKLAAVLGLPLGWLGRDALLVGLVLPHLLHGGLVVGLLVARRVRRDTLLPLGPALLAGAWLAALLG
ncbi:prepilin peptidase [Micromonospora sp. WMMD1155]|uniref:prepilin peptidase n=1 Tax=Micromonospora sp. WMMD1155 TaxID=3016094 RepID=UPI00249C0D28|nr:prepilin peptidase [Micromonospora sp. WMMD1155]WFE51061.1 prepilin peptidase [Micromonospora sp. WMMD1155]